MEPITAIESSYLINVLSKLIRIPSRSFPEGGEEEAVQKFFAAEISKHNLPVDSFEPNEVPEFFNHPLCHGPDRNYRGRNTVITQIGPSDAPGILVLAHSDTVDIASPDAWIFDPYSGEVAQNRMRGLGSTDDKWGMAVILGLIKRFAPQASQLRKRLVFASTIDEESGVCNGTLLLKLRGIQAECALYLDGSDAQVCVGNAGGSNLYLTPLSALSPETSEAHAVALDATCDLESKIRSSLFDRQYFEHNTVREQSLKFRRNPNNPSEFIVHFYTLPGETREQTEAMLEHVLTQSLGSDVSLYNQRYREPWFEASIIPKKPVLLKLLCEAVREELGHDAVITTVSKQDCFIFNNSFDIPCISFGVVSSSGEGTYHEPNESLPIDKFLSGYQTVLNTLIRWLATEET